METVSRKVSDKDPTITGWYLTDIGKIFYTTEFNHFFKNSLNLEKVYPEYWYEEVPLEDLLTEINFMHFTQLAKERYEKALVHVKEYSFIDDGNNEYCNLFFIEDALKIAAGLVVE